MFSTGIRHATHSWPHWLNRVSGRKAKLLSSREVCTTTCYQIKQTPNVRQQHDAVEYRKTAECFISVSMTATIQQIQLLVQWILVGGKWTRVSAMGYDLPDSALNISKISELQKEYNFILMIPDRFQLDAQIKHKLAFFREHMPRTNPVYVMGHSIGSYMMLKILPDLISEGFCVEKAVGLFPTIEHMADSPNGRRLKPILAFFDCYDFLVKILLWWIDVLPFAVKEWLCNWNIDYSSLPQSVLAAAVELMQLNVLRNVIHLANDELRKVTDLDKSLLQFPEKLMFYYGKTDGWCPLEYGKNMERFLPAGQVLIDDDGCEHAFVIKYNDLMAKRVAKMIY